MYSCDAKAELLASLLLKSPYENSSERVSSHRKVFFHSTVLLLSLNERSFC